jgi:hypothetical protein
MKWLKRIPFYPLVFALYPVLAMLAHNIAEVKPDVGWRALLVSPLLAGILWGSMNLILKDWRRSALLATLCLLVFFSYGYVYDALRGVQLAGIIIGRHRYLIAALVVMLGAGGWWLVCIKHDLDNLTPLYNLIAILLIAFPVFQLGSYSLRAAKAQSIPSDLSEPYRLKPPEGALPDIYYIILDMYARDDILKTEFGYDNMPFIQSLEKRGFYVARCSQSNYGQTSLSMASSLNMAYLSTLSNAFKPGNNDRTALVNFIKHSKVREELSALGYKTVSLSAFEPLKIEDADYYYTTNPEDLPKTGTTPLVNPFEAMLIRSTAVSVLMDLLPQAAGTLAQDVNYPFADHIQQQLYILSKLPDLPALQGPKFTLVHIQIPHPPFVFGPDGEIVTDPPPFPWVGPPIEPEYYHRIYTDQVTFINFRILSIVDQLIARSDPAPVIILQADHGTMSSSRLAIINAYYLGGHLSTGFYPGITPVNTFRLIFDRFFGGNYGLLDDRSYWSEYNTPYELVQVANNCQLH